MLAEFITEFSAFIKHILSRTINISAFKMLLKILTVAALATFEIYAAIPTGYAMGLSPWIILLASIIGGVTGIFITVFFGERIRRFFYSNQHKVNRPIHHPILHHILKKYGIIGLGVLGTIILGAPITIGVGVAINANVKRLPGWCCIGVVVRCIIFTLIGYYGIQLF